MRAFERRWAEALMSAFAPVGGPGLAPLEQEVDYLGTLSEVRRESTRRAAFGMRLAIWLMALAPIWLWRRMCTVNDLGVDERCRLLDQLLSHPRFAVRELATLLKLVTSFALLGTDSVRERSGYDNVQAPERVESGVRTRLPVVTLPVSVPPAANDGRGLDNVNNPWRIDDEQEAG